MLPNRPSAQIWIEGKGALELRNAFIQAVLPPQDEAEGRMGFRQICIELDCCLRKKLRPIERRSLPVFAGNRLVARRLLPRGHMGMSQPLERGRIVRIGRKRCCPVSRDVKREKIAQRYRIKINKLAARPTG